MFQFKQFNVDQSGCAMKINTDGVLLGAITEANDPATILDIGTGTGVIALMLAQKFTEAKIDAVEIDTDAAQTAKRNFEGSPFADRLNIYALGFDNYFELFPEKKYDLIVSNPPFYTSSLKSPGAKKTLAKHTDIDFFERLIKEISGRLSPDGLCWLILPVGISEAVADFAEGRNMFLQKLTDIHSYPRAAPHRNVLCFGFDNVLTEIDELNIYKAVGIYSEEYQKLLQPYFLAF
ncbi:MAG TPA: methyltransferase [Mucilaginibacter sp.]|jgi:tRNA1Val (adenine37-N6)-methyltransferase